MKIRKVISLFLTVMVAFGVVNFNSLKALAMNEVNAVISSGNNHCMAIKDDNSLWSWGENTEGQLGLGDLEGGDNRPVKIMDSVKTVSSGEWGTMIVKTDGSLWGCGQNAGGEMGNGNLDKVWTPIKIMDSVTSVSMGYYVTAAIKTDGSLWMWGKNDNHQVNASDDDRN